MVDFTKRVGASNISKKVNPIHIYDSLDRRSETGPLRPSQDFILKEWFEKHKKDKDLIVKLHTGEGKTLIGLLMLQSRLNSKQKPCVYVCPNIYLVEQTCLEAEKFGIQYCKIGSDNEIPSEVLDGKKILIVHVQKIFNGKSIFGLDSRSISISSIVLDDSHTCIEAIKDSFTVKVKKKHPLYSKILKLFEEDLTGQGEGTFLEIESGEYNSLLSIPYWSWIEKKSEVLNTISEHKDDLEIMFAWPIIKDRIDQCQAFITGNDLEISPIHAPIHHFGSFEKASQRILMSATTQDDSFVIKGLGFDVQAVQSPLTNTSLKWSGEKMLLLPNLIDDSLDRDTIISKLAKPNSKRKYGIVSIIPDSKKAIQYKSLGAKIVTTNNIFKVIRELKNGETENTVVIVNRYDGIDLPDQSCRILLIDSKPHFNSLSERYEESCRVNSDIISIKMAQKIEQGIGRSVRGEKDYSVIILVGEDLIKFVKSSSTNKYFSVQTKKQIEIGLEIAKMAKDELEDSQQIWKVIRELVGQSLYRDEGWKQFYKTTMDTISDSIPNKKVHTILGLERIAGKACMIQDIETACEKVQEICDLLSDEDGEKGWYLQVLARYKYFLSKSDSNRIQKSAFRCNTTLLKPKEGITYKKLKYINENRIKRMRAWIKKYSSYEDLMISIDGILGDFTFGMPSEKFEAAVKDIGESLGFLSQRPDNEFKKGPDNLWCGVGNHFIFLECKSEVKDDREVIKKSEAGQMNTHSAWFEKEYGNVTVKRILVIPTKNLSYNADFTHDVSIMKKGTLKKLKGNLKSFFKEFKNYNINDLSDEKLNQWIDTHNLDMDSLSSLYSEKYYHNKK